MFTYSTARGKTASIESGKINKAARTAMASQRINAVNRRNNKNPAIRTKQREE
ncbi:hypothetical protein WH47_12500 [Habropoda laboriosa]|uniref:Uncharacterized protein n=1 Tax=Habropoda laboriosa TaxID=597456 RepID=A0A0L7R023_9HYME|nr:hypothetical protein WH47_12500 [Habropoda laboriosa]